MKSNSFFRYLLVMIMTLSTTINAIGQQRSLKIYFNEYVEGATTPQILVTDDNNIYDLPIGLTVSQEGVVWANDVRYQETFQQDVTDRVIADFVTDKDGNVDKTESHLKLSFSNFPYEVNIIQWNVMNDLLSGSMTNFFQNYGITTKCTPVSGSAWSYTKENWSMNFFSHQTTFTQGDIPWQDGATLDGLESFEISENYETKTGIGGWTLIDLGQSELNDKNRTFIKAGWNGVTGTGSNIQDSDDDNWAFKVMFTLPDIRMRSYAYDKASGEISQQDNYIYQGEKKVHALQGYISAHAGALEPTYDPTDQSEFHFEYFADETQMKIQKYSGVILEAKVAGDIPVTVKLMRGRDREVCRYTQTIRVLGNNTYIVELRKGPASVVGGTNNIVATYGESMPEGDTITAPTLVGYDFGGYYDYANNQYTTCYYDKDMKSVHVWDKTDNLYISAKWLPHTVIVHLDADGGENYGISQFTILYGAKLPTTAEGVQKPSKNGYTFGGYFTKRNGAGTQYYNADMAAENMDGSKKRWNIDEPEVTLYAYWIPNTYLVTLNKQGGTGGTTSVTGTYGQPLPSGKTAPTKPGYEFKGYYSNENQEYYEAMGQDYGGRQYYDKDMNAVEPWDLTYSATIYAHWKPATFIVTLDADGGVLPNPVVEDNAGNFAITKVSDNKIELKLIYKLGKANNLAHSVAKKPGYELLGWFDAQGNKVIEVDEKSRNSFITSTGGYWEETNGQAVWSYTKNLTLTAQYRQKYQTPAEYVIAFDNEKVEAGEDWLWTIENDLVGAAKEVYQKTGKQTKVFDLRKSKNMWTGDVYDCRRVRESLQNPAYSEFISPDVIIYFNEGSYNDDVNNQAVASITLSDVTTSMAIGATKTIIATVNPSNADIQKLSWKSTNTSVAKVSSDGVVTAVGIGTANITATSTDGSNITATCKVTVVANIDVNTYANVVFFEDSEAFVGHQTTISLKMNNEIAPTGFQCDVYLPEGVTVAKDADNFNLISLSTKRTTAQKTNYFDSAEQPDGAIRIMCSSTKNYTFSGNDGEVATITLNVSDEMEEGDYPLILKNIVISDANSKSYTVDYVKSTLTISSYTLGDANNDGNVNVSDFTAIASYIMGTPPSTFVKKAADVNADTEINVADLTGVATIILYGSFNPTSNAKGFVAVEPSVLSVRNQTVKAGTEFTIDVNINGKYAFSGYQFDMNLPEGISVKTIDNRNTDFFASGMTGENTMRVLSASTNGKCFEGTEGCVARITLVTDENLEAGDYAIDMNNIIISSNGNSQTLNDTKFVVHVGETTCITNINAEGEFTIYDMTGKMVKKATSLDGLKKGVYVVNGHKVIK